MSTGITTQGGTDRLNRILKLYHSTATQILRITGGGATARIMVNNVFAFPVPRHFERYGDVSPVGTVMLHLGCPYQHSVARFTKITAGWAGLNRKRSFVRNEELREIDSSRRPVVSPVPIFRSFVSTALQLNTLVIRSVTANNQSGVLHVRPTGGPID